MFEKLTHSYDPVGPLDADDEPSRLEPVQEQQQWTRGQRLQHVYHEDGGDDGDGSDDGSGAGDESDHGAGGGDRGDDRDDESGDGKDGDHGDDGDNGGEDVDGDSGGNFSKLVHSFEPDDHNEDDNKERPYIIF